MTAVILLVCWGLVAVGLVLVAVAVISVGTRMRPLRRALRRLSWRREDVERLRAHAEAVRDRLDALQAQLATLSEAAQARAAQRGA